MAKSGKFGIKLTKMIKNNMQICLFVKIQLTTNSIFEPLLEHFVNRQDWLPED
jgi:hypothetical protein